MVQTAASQKDIPTGRIKSGGTKVGAQVYQELQSTRTDCVVTQATTRWRVNVIAGDFELFFSLFLSFIYSSYTYPSIILHTFHPEVKPEHEITLVIKDEYRRSTTSPRRYTSPFPTRLPLSRRIYLRSLSTARSLDEDEEPRPELDSELPRSPILQRRQGPRHDLPISIG